MASHLFYVRKTDVLGLNSLLDIAQLDNLSNWRGHGTARNRTEPLDPPRHLSDDSLDACVISSGAYNPFYSSL